MSRIAFVLPRYLNAPSGGYRIVYTYASYLAALGHEVTVYHASLPAGHAYPPSLGRFDLRRAMIYRAARATARRTPARPTWFDLDARVDVRHVTRLSPRGVSACDVVVATAVHTAPLVAAVAKRQSIRGVYFLQHFEDWLAPTDFVESTWRLPLTLVVIAPWLQEKALELGVTAVLVPNAIDPADIPPGPEIAERKIDVLALVSEVAWKRADLVAAVMSGAAASVDPFRAVTFGTCPRPHGLPDSVAHYENPDRSQLRGLYQDARIYLCASDGEGWHLPPAEAMAAGTAVVSTDIGGVRAYAASTALFAPVGDATGLTDSVLELLRNPDRCQIVARAGQQAILSFSPSDAGAAFARVLLPDE